MRYLCYFLSLETRSQLSLDLFTRTAEEMFGKSDELFLIPLARSPAVRVRIVRADRSARVYVTTSGLLCSLWPGKSRLSAFAFMQSFILVFRRRIFSSVNQWTLQRETRLINRTKLNYYENRLEFLRSF